MSQIQTPVCSKKELSTMKMEDLKQKITDLQAIIYADDNSKEKIANRMKELRNKQKQKQTSLKSITNEINQYFSDRKQTISKNNQICDSLHDLRMEFNEQMYKMENFKLLFQKKENINDENNAKKDKSSKIEKLTQKSNKLHSALRKSYMSQNDIGEMDKIDKLITKRNNLLSEINEIKKECFKLQTNKNRKTVCNKLEFEILSAIYSMRESKIKTKETLTTSQSNRKRQNINTEILNENRKEQRQALYDKLEEIESELTEYTNLNIYCSPSISVRNSITSLPDNISVSEFESSQYDINDKENKQSITNLIQYLQDFLPLKMRKRIETLKMKINDLEINDDCFTEFDYILENMSLELQNKQCIDNKENEKEMTHFYLNHNMNIFDEFDKLGIKVPLIKSDIPQAVKALLERINILQHTSKLFAIV